MEKHTMIMLACLFVFVLQTSSTTAQTYDGILAARQAIQDGLNAHNLELVMPHIADHFTAEHSWDVTIRDRQAFKSGWESTIAAFPDEVFVNTRVLVTDGVLVAENWMQGTYMGVWNGLPPTGEKGAPFHYADVWDYQGLQMTHLMMYGDMQSVLVSAKVMPKSELPPLVPSFPIPDPVPTGLTPKEVGKEVLKRWNAHDLSSWIKAFSNDADIYSNIVDMKLTRAETVALFEMNFAGFPDVQCEDVRVVEFGDGWLLSESVLHGTHTGTWFGIPATGLPYKGLRVAQIARYNAEGLCTYWHTYYDNITVLVQIGVFGKSSSENWELYR